LLDVNLRPPTLDDVFLRLTDGSTRAGTDDRADTRSGDRTDSKELVT
jgi:ABC-2 type transport system ATP-binding protein